MKIVFLDYATLGGSSLAPLELFGSLDIRDTTDKKEVFEALEGADIAVTNKVVLDKETLGRLSKLRLICIAATGVNNVDLEGCKELGIAVCNVKGYSTSSVVQALFSSLFYAISNVHKFDSYVKSKEYAASKTFTCTEFCFGELSGKKIGIIGFGEIGQKVAKAAEAFGMEPMYYSTSGDNNDKTYPRVELDFLLKNSDVVSIHCALTETTKNLIDKERLSKLSKEAILINFARGGIVDEAALVTALNEDKLGMYIADVFEKEPIEPSSPLFLVKDQSKLILTPHIGWASVEARDRLIAAIADNIKAFLNNERKNRVV